MSKTHDIPDAETRRAMFTTYRLMGKPADYAGVLVADDCLKSVRCQLADNFIYFRRRDGGRHAISIHDLACREFRQGAWWVEAAQEQITSALQSLAVVIYRETGEEV